MKILSAEQIKAWDQFTIEKEPISSIDLMERAAMQCVKWIENNKVAEKSFVVFCGKGNNGGDGLAIARILAERNYQVNVYILEFGHKGTNDFQENLARLHQYPTVDIRFIQTEQNFPSFSKQEIIIDALYGSGLNRPLEGVTARLVEYINDSLNEIISIDIPSGLFVDKSSKGNPVIHARYTLSFQCYKPAFLMPENADLIGIVHILEIGLLPEFLSTINNSFELIDDEIISLIYRPRNQFAHKGDFGHSLMIVGSYGKMGAAVLAAGACLRSGAGLLTCHIPKCGYEIMQVAIPEAMIMTDFNSSFISKIEFGKSKFNAIGIGPGIGTASETKSALREILSEYNFPIVVDADALNIIASDKNLIDLIPKHSILTPHPKEFERLFGNSVNDFDRIELAKHKASELDLVIVLKGHHTFIAIPGEKAQQTALARQGFFNSTGNAGMATAGSGDVLTGILTGLLAQGYKPADAALLGVYLHGLAGDYAAQDNSMEAMIASDITNCLKLAFQRITGGE